MFKVFVIIVSLGFAKVEGEKINREDLKKNILKGCLEMSSAVPDKKKKICDCVVINFDKKLNNYQLKLIAENYKPNNDNVAPESDVPSTAIQTFDYEVATECIKNYNWRIQDKK